MKRILQDLKNGEVVLAEVPRPRAREGHVLIQTRATLVSAGTERMLTEFGSASLIGKARQQPRKVRQVLDKSGRTRTSEPQRSEPRQKRKTESQKREQESLWVTATPGW